MALMDRIDGTDPDPNRRIAAHRWGAALWGIARGWWTKTQVENRFAMTVQDKVQFDQLIAHYQGLSAADKDKFFSDMESLNILLHHNDINRSQYLSLLGMTE